ncbi:hypothetical protein CYMTET_22304 [Cymbomonas tetramitiformis]|uniref:Uncharacterized protein n=1 Tax=Cymbomonas tetramitiformis TaxID=36881 RepID=A0AAE0L2B7_9CHLO|nr:hypothetical protein CYMTET_22304 [Cymbomonas tetramitiformis]
MGPGTHCEPCARVVGGPEEKIVAGNQVHYQHLKPKSSAFVAANSRQVDASRAEQGFYEGRYPIIAWMDFDEDESVQLWDFESPAEENGIPSDMFAIVAANVKGIMASGGGGSGASGAGASGSRSGAGASGRGSGSSGQ